VNARRKDFRIPFRVRPMLATLVAEPFHKPGWVYEEKYDGDRILAYKEGGAVRLLSRNDNDHTADFHEIATEIGRLPSATLLLDGEVIALDAHGISRFQLLQRGTHPRIYAVFDCLYDGRDLRGQPLKVRRGVLESLVGESRILPLSRRLADDGLAAYRIAQRHGYEGVVAKDLSSVYVEGRSARWLKIKVRREEEFVIAGYTAPSGARRHFGSLLLGGYRDGNLHYVGKVGTGFSGDALGSLFAAFQEQVRPSPALVDPPREKNVTYLSPAFVAQIAFQEWTADGKLRQPVFLGLRDDKQPRDCVLPSGWPAP
jgi:bifunctional non-homologous end joining protein LigD